VREGRTSKAIEDLADYLEELRIEPVELDEQGDRTVAPIRASKAG